MSPDHQTSDRIYTALKSDLLHDRLGAALLNITALSNRYGASATPVREAMLRLVGEQLIILPAGGGFASAELSAREVRDLYDLNMRLLLIAAQLVGDDISPSGASAISSDLDPPVDVLFLNLCERAGNEALLRVVASVNDRLHRSRLIEADRLTRVQEEYAALLQTRGRALRAAIIRYHKKRMRFADALTPLSVLSRNAAREY